MDSNSGAVWRNGSRRSSILRLVCLSVVRGAEEASRAVHLENSQQAASWAVDATGLGAVAAGRYHAVRNGMKRFFMGIQGMDPTSPCPSRVTITTRYLRLYSRQIPFRWGQGVGQSAHVALDFKLVTLAHLPSIARDAHRSPEVPLRILV